MINSREENTKQDPPVTSGIKIPFPTRRKARSKNQTDN
jgi:hypothetical protein